MLAFALVALLFAGAAVDAADLAFGATTTIQTGTTTHNYATVAGIGTQFQVTYQNNAGAAVDVKLEATLWVSGVTSIFFNAFSFLNGGGSGLSLNAYTALSIGLYQGWTLTTTPANAQVTATFTFPAVDAVTASLLTAANVDAGVLKVDTATNTYVRIPATYVPNPYQFSATLPGAGTYVVAAINEEVDVSASVGAAVTWFTPASSNQRWKVSVKLTDDLLIQYNSSVQNNITITPKTQSSYPPPKETNISLGAYWVATVQSAATFSAKVQYTYTQAQLTAAAGASATADRLRLAYYDTSANAWQFVNSGYTIDAQARVIATTTTHFSEWSVYYTHENASAMLHAKFGLVALLVALLWCFN